VLEGGELDELAVLLVSVLRVLVGRFGGNSSGNKHLKISAT
jgi:hypothetical protein